MCSETPSTDCLQMRGVRVVFRTGHGAARREVVACNDLDVQVARGEIVGLVGESGSGKSTLGRVMAGLQLPNAGDITIDGADRTSRIRPGFGGAVQMVFQNPAASLNPKMRVSRTLAYAARRAGIERSKVGSAIRDALREVGIEPAEKYLPRYPHELSGGQQQRIALARALLYEPRYLVADEPTSALDVSVRVQIIGLIQQLQERHRMGILFITHDLSVVRALADRALVMFRGDIVEEGGAQRVFATPEHDYTRTLLDSTPRLDPPPSYGELVSTE